MSFKQDNPGCNCCGAAVTTNCPCSSVPDVLNASVTNIGVCAFGANFSGTLTYSATVPADISAFTRGAGWFSAFTTCPNGNQYRWCLICSTSGPNKLFSLYSFSPTTGELLHAQWTDAFGTAGMCAPVHLASANSSFKANPTTAITITP